MARGHDYAANTAFKMPSQLNSSALQKADALSLLQKLRRAAWLAYCFFSYSHMGPLLERGLQKGIDELSAEKFHPSNFAAAKLLNKFHSIYEPMTKKGRNGSSLDMGWALIKQERCNLISHFVWAAAEVCVRLSIPFVFRQFLIWLEDYRDDEADYAEGWLWGSLLALGSFLLLLTHHQPFWLGLSTGFKMRITAVSAIHSKLLKLNASCIGRVSQGHIINLISNDVQRFDLGVVYSPYLILGPFEAVMVTIFVSRVLGILPAVAGMSCTLLLIPTQILLSKLIVRYRTKTAKVTDRRINLTSEIISGSLAVKMLGWEEPLLNDVCRIRKEEHESLTAKNYVRAANLAFPSVNRGIMICATFVTYRFTDGDFNMPDVFFALSLMILPTLTMAMFFVAAGQFGSEILVATRRIDKFLKTLEPPLKVEKEQRDGKIGSINVQHKSSGWYSLEEEKKNMNVPKSPSWSILSRVKSLKGKTAVNPKLIQTLTDIDFAVRPGELVGIVGQVGSGKSSLLLSLLGEMEQLSGDERSGMNGTVAYCSQIPWILAGSVRENILFGQSFDEELYKEVVSSCALNVDLEQFPDGDNTEIGERGINISGGQKARLALARAAYFQADITLLDDPLSAVDARVGRVLFEKCIGPGSVMKNSTRLLVTHQRQFLPKCDRIVVMNGGEIQAIGTWEELHDLEIIEGIEKDNSAHEPSVDEVETALSPSQAPQLRSDANSEAKSADGHKPDKSKRGPAQLVKKEGKEMGKIAANVYVGFVRHIGVVAFSAVLLSLMAGQTLLILSDWWVARWSSASEDSQDEMKWVWTLVSFASTSAIVTLLAVLAFFALIVRGSTRLHNAMIRRVMRAPLKFFHTNPVGRILNRFSKDTGLQDEELPYVSADMLINCMAIMGTFLVVAAALPYMLAVFAVILWFFWRVRVRYVRTSREVKRFDGITRSPVYAMISANLKGLSTIRAYKKEKEFQDKFLEAADSNGAWWSSFLLTSRWVGVRMDFISTLVMFFSVLLALLLSKKVSPEVLGLALTYVIRLSGMMQWTMRQSAELENTMTAVERNMEYTRLEQEPPTVLEGGAKGPEGWPGAGEIHYQSMTAAYRHELEPVLKELQFVIPGGSSVGIVGRTGSGKSSLLLTLFRLIDIREGTIKIDGLDVASIGVDALRKQLAVIPQDPVLFSGTLRSNLDPWNQQSDAKVWAVLRQVCLDSAVDEVGGLDAPIAECGSNLSVGQRQLLCLARALLSDAKILALDEATANVDGVTDGVIQDSLHSLISEDNKTLLIIAHRIDTVMGCDLILVLDGGHMVEFGTPSELLKAQNGSFSRMVSAATQAQLLR